MAAPLGTKYGNAFWKARPRYGGTLVLRHLTGRHRPGRAHQQGNVVLLLQQPGRYFVRFDGPVSAKAWTTSCLGSNEEKDTSLPRLLRYTFSRGVYDKSGSMRLFLIAEAVSGKGDVRDKLLEKYAHFKNVLAQNIAARKPGADGEYLAWLTLTVMDGMLVQSQLKNPALDTDAFIEATARLITERRRQGIRQTPRRIGKRINTLRGYGGIGRRARLRLSGVYDVQVRPLLPAPKRRSFHQEKAASFFMLKT